MEIQEVLKKTQAFAKKKPLIFWGGAGVAALAGFWAMTRGGTAEAYQPDYYAPLEDYSGEVSGGAIDDYVNPDFAYDWGSGVDDAYTPVYQPAQDYWYDDLYYSIPPSSQPLEDVLPQYVPPIAVPKALNDGSRVAAVVYDYANDPAVYYGPAPQALRGNSPAETIAALQNLASNPIPDISRSYNMDSLGNYTYGEVSYPNMYAPGSKWYDAPGRVAPSWYTGETGAAASGTTGQASLSVQQQAQQAVNAIQSGRFSDAANTSSSVTKTPTKLGSGIGGGGRTAATGRAMSGGGLGAGLA